MPRGRKSCPECHALCGPRLATCECGHKFLFKAGKAPNTIGKPPKAKSEEVKEPFEKLTENPIEVIGVSDRQALDTFIEQLKACRDDSNRNCGCYSAFLRHKHGRLQVEVWFGIPVGRKRG